MWSCLRTMRQLIGEQKIAKIAIDLADSNRRESRIRVQLNEHRQTSIAEMAQTLLTATSFPQFIQNDSKCILISSDDLNNSNFVINQYVQALSKVSISSLRLNDAEQPTSSRQSSTSQMFGILLNQSYASYSAIAMKCGNNLKNLKERNRFRCLDVMGDLERFLVPDAGRNSTKRFDFGRFKTAVIQELTDYFKPDEDRTKLLIIDDITSLLSLNVPLSDLVNFVRFLRHFCSLSNVTLLIQTFVDPSRLEPLVKLDAYLNGVADLVLAVSKLETGYSNKVDGNLEIKNYIANTQQTYLFKSSERSTRLYAPGTI